MYRSQSRFQVRPLTCPPISPRTTGRGFSDLNFSGFRRRACSCTRTTRQPCTVASLRRPPSPHHRKRSRLKATSPSRGGNPTFAGCIFVNSVHRRLKRIVYCGHSIVSCIVTISGRYLSALFCNNGGRQGQSAPFF